jgi:hypothetical protein
VVPNLVICKLGNDGTISLYNYAGDTHVIADVMGWFPAASGFHSLTPLRILDTRVGTGVRGAIGARRTIDSDGLCGGDVPSNAKAIVINVTAVSPTEAGYITVWPSGEARPESSNLNFVAGQTVPNLVITKVGIEAYHPDQAEFRRLLGKFYHRPPGGESWCDVILRLRSATEMISREYCGERVLLVGHSVVVLCMRYLLEHMTEDQILKIDRESEVANCSVTSYKHDASAGPKGQLRLELFNFVAPLEEAGAPVTSRPDAKVAAK